MKVTSAARLQIIGPAWTRTFRCLWMLEELRIPYEHLPHRPFSRNVRAYHPSGKVPLLLVYDDATATTPSFQLTESVAINTYLGDLYSSSSSSPLVPLPGTRARAQYDQVCCTILSELDAQGLWIHRKHGQMGKRFGEIPEAVEAAHQQFTRMLPTLLVANDNRPYLLGNDFTAADILLVHCLDWAEHIGWNNVDDGTNPWNEYVQRCHDRPAYQNVLAHLVQQNETSHL